MKAIRKRLTYANVMSSLAVFMVLGGGAAIASNHILPKGSVGTPQLQKNAVKTGKVSRNAIRVGKLAPEAVKAGKLAKNAVPTNRLRDNAVTGGKIANGAVLTDKLGDAAVTTGKIANDAVGTGKIANDAVTAGKLAPSERSEAFVQSAPGLTAELPTGTLGAYNQANTRFTANLAAGLYLVHAQMPLINASVGNIRYVVCRLLDDSTSIDLAGATLEVGLLVPSGTASLVGISDGGRIDIVCRANGTGVFGFQPKVIANRIGSVG